MERIVKITDFMIGRKIEYVLSGDLQLSKNIIKKLKITGGILLNGEAVHVDRRLCEGDVLVLNLPDEKTGNIIPEEIDLDILYEDEDILAVNKAAGMIIHPVGEKKSGTLANGVMFYLKGKAAFHVITRLDKETSGAVLIAKNALSAQRLSEAMQKRDIKKEYIAVTDGVPEKMKGIINAPIKRAEGIKRIVASDGKEAVTKFYVEKISDGKSFIRLLPVTGRTHQIRVHLSYMGTPIYGDWLYGNAREGRVRLHCEKLEFIHPSTNERMKIKAPIPNDITTLVK